MLMDVKNELNIFGAEFKARTTYRRKKIICKSLLNSAHVNIFSKMKYNNSIITENMHGSSYRSYYRKQANRKNGGIKWVDNKCN